jgi:hypothetical protein
MSGAISAARIPIARRVRRTTRVWAAALLVGVAVLGAAGLAAWRDDILAALLDPQLPFAVYQPPPAPDYAKSSAWALLPATPPPQGAAVFFIHSTTFDGGRDWNGPIDDRAAARRVATTVLPNYAAPFAAAGPVFAPRYRQASLFTSLTLFDDAIEAREFAYGDIARAFQAFLVRIGPDRPFIVAGVEQGGQLAARLLQDQVAPRPDLRSRLVAAYLMKAVTPAADHLPGSALPACERRAQAGCVVAWISAPTLDFVRIQKIFARSLVWRPDGRLVGLAGRAPLCVDPLLGAASDATAPPRLNQGAASATGLEWGVRPGFMARQVGARCEAGVLRVTTPRSALLRPSGGWADRLRAPGYNLFWADMEADAQGRAQAWFARHPATPQPADAASPSARQSNSDRSAARARPRSEANAGSRASISRASSAATAIRSRWATGSARA